ncbi:hypothetical protein B0H14DRAFT_2833228 [Mycena olivaceomarginata]|nr:hypothetical protein B0H14DRAFT_2833228 [Mycena olivaceomarginata]
MKFLHSLALSSFLATATFAQNVVIGAPADGTTVTPGSNMTVEVDRPNSLTGSTEVAVVIGFLSCVGFNSETILYNGPYDPEFHTNVSRSKPPHQNFTVTIPATARTGPAQLSVTHLSLVGAGPFPLLETLNMTLNVENS